MKKNESGGTKNSHITPPKTWKRWLSRLVSRWMIVFFLGIAVSLVSQNTTYYLSNIAYAPAPAFDGTVYPIQKAPDWVATPAGQWDLKYSEFDAGKLIDIPLYDPKLLATSTDSLKWGNRRDDGIRNMKITYSVPYMGNYRLGGGENTGSHLAVDIKVLRGTPVYAIANGVVTQASAQTYGFGNHVVIKHEKVPVESILYSAYAHLDSFTVSKGETITKGQLIGYVGQTGTATTPHLHFQIDRASAPWHPYWPFTSKEASTAGMSFFDAINNGLGKERALEYTVNPMMFVQNNLGTPVNAAETVETPAKPVTEVVNTPVTPVKPVTEERVLEPDEIDVPPTKVVKDDPAADTLPYSVDFVIRGDTGTDEGEDLYLLIEAIGPDGSKTSNFEGGVNLSSTEPLGELSAGALTAADFVDGSHKLKISALKAGSFQLVIKYQNKEFTSADVVVRPKAVNVAAFKVEHDGVFLEGVAENVSITAVDKNSRTVSDFSPNSAVTLTVYAGEGELSQTTLTAGDFTKGVAKVKFTSSSQLSALIKASYGDITGASEYIKSGLFADVSNSHPNYRAIYYLKNQGVISGYSDGKFLPEKAVSRVEALKMILSALEYNVSEGKNIVLSFSDISLGSWYSPYLVAAVDAGIVRGYNDNTFKPENSVTNSEFYKMLIEASGGKVGKDLTNKPYYDVDVEDWYAPYANHVRTKRILPSSVIYFRARDKVTRGEVAEAIYRVLMMKKNDATYYRDSLS